MQFSHHHQLATSLPLRSQSLGRCIVGQQVARLVWWFLTFLSFVGVAEFFRGRGGGLKLEINIPSQRIRAKRKGGLINKGGVISSEYGNC